MGKPYVMGVVRHWRADRFASRVATLAAGLFVLSLVVPALAVVQKPLLWGKSSDELVYGIHCLLLGFFVWPAWLANPLMLVAWAFYELGRRKPDRYVVSAWLAGCAAVAGILSPFLLAGGGLFRLRYLHVGFYLWIASMVCLAVAAISRSCTRSHAYRSV